MWSRKELMEHIDKLREMLNKTEMESNKWFAKYCAADAVEKQVCKEKEELEKKFTEYNEKYDALFKKYINLADKYVALQERMFKKDDGN